MYKNLGECNEPVLHITNFTNNVVLDKNTFEKADYDLSDHNRGLSKKNGI